MDLKKSLLWINRLGLKLNFEPCPVKVQSIKFYNFSSSQKQEFEKMMPNGEYKYEHRFWNDEDDNIFNDSTVFDWKVQQNWRRRMFLELTMNFNPRKLYKWGDINEKSQKKTFSFHGFLKRKWSLFYTILSKNRTFL